jgi:hypothetical protein
MSKLIRTPKFRMAFPNLITAQADASGKKSWSVAALFPVDADMTELRAEAKRIAEEKWGKNIPANLILPFADGNTKGKIDGNGQFKPYEGYKDTIVMNFKRAATTKNGENTPPTIVAANPKTVLSDPKEVYAGRWARAVVNGFAYEYLGKKGVSFGLNHIQLLDHDTPLGTSNRPEDLFDDEQEENEATASFMD